MILVFGRTGQVATALQNCLPKARFLSREDADLSRPEGLFSLVRDCNPSLVINAAAYTAVDRAEEEEALATAINGTAPGEIARASAELGVPFLHVSTDYVFDGSGDAPWTPDAPTGPLGAYGRSKLAGERAVRAAGGEHVILRTAWVFSTHGQNFLKTMLRLSETRDSLSVVEDQIGGPTPADAIAGALATIAGAFAAGQGVGGTYHVSGAPDVSWADFAREIFAQAGRVVTVTGIPASDYPTPAARPANSRLDCGTLFRDYGIARPDWRAGVAQVLGELGS